MKLDFNAQCSMPNAQCALDISALRRLQHRASAISDAEFRQDARRVVLDGALGGAQRLGDFAIAVAAGHQSQNLDAMLGACIAATTALLVVNAPTAGLARTSMIVWLAPTIVGTPATAF
jgi:hypothetical protein